jgi:ribosomal-protein-alanine N-acetyltransferase
MRLDVDVPPAFGCAGLFLLTPAHVSSAYVGWLNDPEINQYLESRFVAHTIESTRAFVGSVLDSPDSLFLGIRAPDTGTHVGNIKLGPISAYHRTGDIGLLIGERSAWGKGVGTSAIEGLVRIATEQLSLRKLTAGCYASNIGSRRAFEKAGFLLEGVRPKQFLLNGRSEELVLLGKCLE